MSLANLAGIARSESDPRIQQTGPSSLTSSDRLARALGWFSVGLGLVELTSPGLIARTLGLEGKEGLIRTFGARELGSAIPTLSVDKPIGLLARVAGDALDLATLTTALRRDNPKRDNAVIAMVLVLGITVLDLVALADVKTVHRRGQSGTYDYSDRSGFPGGAEASHGLARKDFDIPDDYSAQGRVQEAISAAGR